MFRNDNSTAALALPAPTVPGPNPDSFFTDGQPGVTAPSMVDAEFMNMIQEEVAAVIIGAGLNLDKANRAQLLAAIVAMVAASAGLKKDVSETLTVGMLTASLGLGNLNSATTLTIGNRTLQHGTMTGGFTLTAPNDIDEGAMVLELLIDGVGGHALGLAGFALPVGGAFDSAAGVINKLKIIKGKNNTSLEIIQGA